MMGSILRLFPETDSRNFPVDVVKTVNPSFPVSAFDERNGGNMKGSERVRKKNKAAVIPTHNRPTTYMRCFLII